MKLAYLILAHKEPLQIKRLVNRLSDPLVDIYIHVDNKAPLHLFKNVIGSTNVYFVKKRENVNWGGFSIVKATLHGFKEIVESSIKYDFVTLLSGEDYPLKSNEQIAHFFNQHKGKAFMEFLSIENDWQEAIPRLKKYFLTDYAFPGSTKLETWLNKMLPVRKPPLNFEYVGRSQWFSISGEQVMYLYDFLKKQKAFYLFFCFVWGSDEFVFQSILYNSIYKQEMINDNLRYIDWSEGGASPKSLTIRDATKLLSSDKLFARKINFSNAQDLMDIIDAAQN